MFSWLINFNGGLLAYGLVVFAIIFALLGIACWIEDRRKGKR